MPGEAVSRARAVDEEMVSVKREVALPRDWWATGLDGSRGLWELFGRRPASLDGAVCTRLALHSPLGVRAIVLLADAPDPLPERWRRKGYDAASICLQFLECRDVRSSGALPTGGCSIDVEPVGDDTRARLCAEDFELELTSRFASVRVDPFRRGDPGSVTILF